MLNAQIAMQKAQNYINSNQGTDIYHFSQKGNKPALWCNGYYYYIHTDAKGRYINRWKIKLYLKNLQIKGVNT